MHRRELILGAAGIVGASTLGSVAYTSASVDRSVTSNVASDDSAIIGLTPGPNVDAVTLTNGQLEVDTAVASASGLNSDGTFTYGDTSSLGTAPESQAFSVTNNDGEAHSLDVGVNLTSQPGSSSLQIDLYKGDGTSLGTASPSNTVTVASSDWGAGTTIYAVIKVFTDGTSDSDKISGSITFNA